MNSDKEAVKVLAEGMVKAIRQAVKENNKDYVNSQVKKYSGNASSFSGAINASQVKGLYSGNGFYGSVANIITHAKTNFDSGDQIAGGIVSAINDLAEIKAKSVVADEVTTSKLNATIGNFISLVADKAEITDATINQARIDIANIGLTNIGSARISSAQIDVADVNTAFIREGNGGKYYIDNLAVTEGNIYALSVGKLMLKDDNGQMCQLTIDSQTEQIIASPVTFDGDTIINEGTIGSDELDDLAVTTSKIANNAVNGDKILAGSILTKHLYASEIFAKDANIMELIASNISVTTLLAQQGLIQELQTSVISSPDFAEIIDGESIDISRNTAITVANGLIGLMIDTNDPQATSITLTDKMISAVSDNIDVIAEDYITTRVENTLENEIITQDDRPTDPTEGLIWVDTSQTPNKIYKWNGLAWTQIDGSTLDGNSVLINRLIQDMSSRISQKNDEILLQVTRDENAEIEGHVETLNTYVSQIKQQADELSIMVANMSTTYVQIGAPVIKTDGEVWFDPSNANYYVSKLLIDDGNLEFAYDDEGELLYSYTDGFDENHSFRVENNYLMVSYNGDDDDINIDFQIVGGRLGSWRIIENVAFSQLTERVDGISSTVYDSTNGLSAVSQKADKISWLIASGTSSANMTMTPNALSAIANNIALNADRINLTAEHKISAESAKHIDLSANDTINITAAKINAIADSINFSANNSSIVNIANNAASSAAGAVASSKNKVYAQNNAPSGSNHVTGDLWIDTNDNNKLYRWNGSNWVNSRDTSLDGTVTTLDSGLETLNGTVNELNTIIQGKATTYYSTTTPKNPSVGDIWYDARNNTVKRYKNATDKWIDITDSILNKALNRIKNVEDITEGKISTYAQANAPTQTSTILVDGDLWIDTDDNNKLHRWDETQSKWIAIADSHLDYLVDKVDGKTTTFYSNTQPNANSSSTGDIWYNTSDNTICRYNGTSWIDITDNALKKALLAAGTAKSIADGKINTYAQNNKPTETNELKFAEGDLWIDTNDGNKLHRWNKTQSKWIPLRDDHLDYLINEVSGKTTIYYADKAHEPSSGEVSEGDVWYNTTDNTIERYNGSEWVDITDNALKKALTAAGDAKSIADGKIMTYAQDSMPTETSGIQFAEGDLWIDTNDNNKLYRWDGKTAKWVAVRDTHNDSAISTINANITTINQKIEDNTIVSTVLNNEYYINDFNARLAEQDYSTVTQTKNAIVAEIGKITVGSRNLILNSEELVTFNGETSQNVYTAEWQLSSQGKSELNAIGTEYTTSFTAKSTVSENHIFVSAIKYDSNNNVILCSEENPIESSPNAGSIMPISLTTSFKRYTSTMKISKTGATAIRVCVLLNSNPGTISMKLIQTESGNKASSWNLAPEDVKANIDSVELIAQQALSSTECIVGTQAIATNAWTGQASFNTLTNGQVILYWLPFDGTNSNATLNLTLSSGETTGAKRVYINSTTRCTNHIQAGNMIQMIYRENVLIEGSTYTGWWITRTQNTNDYDRVQFNNNIKAKTAILSSRVIVGDSNGYFHLASGSIFDIDKPILWATSAIETNATGKDNYLSYPSCTLRNNAGSSWSAIQYQTLYLAGTLFGNSFTVANTNWLTTSPSNETLTYISLGYMSTTYQMYLYPEHPMYRFVNGEFKAVSQIAYEAQIAANNANDSIEEVQEEFKRVVRIETDGLHVGDNQTNGEVVIDSESVNIVVNEVKYSKFAADYVQFGNYQLRRTSDGGLAFKMYNS